jgi:hypothetical protein
MLIEVPLINTAHSTAIADKFLMRMFVCTVIAITDSGVLIFTCNWYRAMANATTL